ncbi:down syndrome cell adhesion molecule-like protein Dscam2 [Trichonephila inaurata madagascariensis]|uniref:Down syndrome cell adhesion molecule-like protein Dscam2 n=1 Tax=Trichonephila inaurata madagascariensis TaxID=2747483 RepID=A0A8X6XFI4_9ARAC|nr:down syndrome cell adhesion molecule-like protein Dscam2 [Trichonephila inaurata madagascariensis]
MRSIVTCAVLSGDPPMTTQWLKDGADIPLELEPKIEMIDEYTTYLKFSAVGPHHNGNYTCIAKNPAATVNYTALLVVNVPPYWRSQPTDRSAVMGESLTVDCQANGFPVPQVRWKKDHDFEKSKQKLSNSVPVNPLAPSLSLVLPIDASNYSIDEHLYQKITLTLGFLLKKTYSYRDEI